MQLRIVTAQVNLLVGDVTANVARISRVALQARDEFAADAVLFPELTLTGYPPEDLLLRPGLIRRVEKGLQQLCSDVTGIDLIVGYPLKIKDCLYNAASLIRDGRIIATCNKRYLPNYGVFDEQRYFVAGEGFCVVTIKNVPVALTVCEDLWYPDPAQKAVDSGAKLILSLNASPFHSGKAGEREEIIAKRAIENHVPVIYSNLVGGQDELVFDGHSFAMDSKGKIMQQSPAFKEAVEVITCRLDNKSVVLQPAKLARNLSYLETIYQALVLGVRDYVEKNGFGGVVIGLSGGIDSALTLAIAVDALGSERVEGVMMPSRYSADMSLEDAKAEAESLGVEYHVIPIEPVFSAFLESLAGVFSGLPTDVTEENIQARCRGILLMAISNKKHKMVLTTGNKSEMAVGYSTLYGDMAGGFAPIKDVPKCLVYELADYRNRISPVIPQRVIERPPSAELAPEQKDEDSLPPYPVLDAILQMYVEQDHCAEEIIASGYDKEVVTRVTALVDRNEYKRRQSPPGVRITRRAFGRDRRYPITSGY